MLAAAALALRLLNPHDVAVDAALRCGEDVRAVRLAAHELRDVEGCAAAEALVPIVAIETSFDDEEREWQQVLDTDAECGTAAMAAPLFACRNGVATAFVAPVDGATYAWSAEGATITGGAATNRIVLQLGDASTTKLTCIITTAECTKTATGAIAVREPIVVKNFTVPATANANQPLTITWSYEQGREPATQMLTGDLFAQPVQLAANARSYSVTPQNGGMRSVELRASYGKTIPIAPPAKKRRRSVGGGVTATECPSATATARVDVKGCIPRQPIVDAPEDVAAGEQFQVQIIDLDDDDKVQWSVDNGAISYVSAFGERVMVVAGTTGRTEVHARVERSAGCFANADASVAILQPVNQCALPPSAALSFVSSNCNAALVRATFTGTPPFAGRWSDGTEFRTSSDFLHHEFNTAGTYGMTDFRDSSCFGTVSGSPSANTLKPTVRIDGFEGCAGGTITATFTGNPPFSGTWSDGQPFTTPNMTVSRAVSDGTWSVQNVTDATCSTTKASSNSVTFAPRPRAWVEPGPECYLERNHGSGYLRTEVAGGKPPYQWTWSDGATSTSQYPRSGRQASNTAETQTYELVRATANGCEATLENRFVTLHKRNAANIEYGAKTYCTGTDITVASAWQPSIGANVSWNLWGSGSKAADPKIISGLGTTALTFRSQISGNAHLGIQTTFPDGLCTFRGNTQDITFANKVEITDLAVIPSTIKRWGTANIQMVVSGGTPITFSIFAQGRQSNVQVKGYGGTYIDTIGPGVVPITVRWSDCSGTHELQTTLTITE